MSVQSTVGKYPPRPRFALAVGVIGHRPNRLPLSAIEEITRQMKLALGAVHAAATAAHARYGDSFAGETAKLSVVTSLAEGADRIGAQEALLQGFSLEVPLPFSADEFVNDFSDQASHQEFNRLLEAATSVLALSGDRTQEGKAYEHSGQVVLDTCDILIAVWDGDASAGRGGTTALLYEAAHMGIPVIHIGTAPDDQMRFYWREPSSHRAETTYFDEEYSVAPAGDMPAAIALAVDSLVRPPRSASEQEAMDDYLCQPFRRFNINVQFPLLLAVLGVRRPRSTDFLREALPSAADEPTRQQIAPASLVEAHRRADECAIYFGQAFRGAFILNFVLSALVTIAATLALPPPASGLEIALVALLVYNTSRGRKGGWHHLWIEAREVAERLRVAMPIHAIGSRPALPFGDAPTWTTWYVRAHLRQAGLRNAPLDASGMAAARQSLLAFLKGQTAYHAATAKRFRTLHERLAAVSKWIFFIALGVSIGVFAAEYFDLLEIPSGSRRWIFVLTAGLPALAAASYGIRVIGEFDGAAARSARMVTQLDGLIYRLDAAGCDFDILREMSHRAAGVMQGDVASWRLVVESRELEMPG